MKFKKKLAVVIAAVSTLIVAIPSIAYAAIPDTSGVIHSCYNSGLLPSFKIYDPSAGQNCGLGQTSLTWSQTGLAAHLVTGDSDTLATDSNGVVTDGHAVALEANCPAGEYAIQGIMVVPPGLEGMLGPTAKTGSSVGISGWSIGDGVGYEVGVNVSIPNQSGTFTAKVICLPVPTLPS